MLQQVVPQAAAISILWQACDVLSGRQQQASCHGWLETCLLATLALLTHVQQPKPQVRNHTSQPCHCAVQWPSPHPRVLLPMTCKQVGQKASSNRDMPTRKIKVLATVCYTGGFRQHSVVYHSVIDSINLNCCISQLPSRLAASASSANC
jgi:hypothetical protein